MWSSGGSYEQDRGEVLEQTEDRDKKKNYEVVRRYRELFVRVSGLAAPGWGAPKGFDCVSEVCLCADTLERKTHPFVVKCGSWDLKLAGAGRAADEVGQQWLALAALRHSGVVGSKDVWTCVDFCA